MNLLMLPTMSQKEYESRMRAFDEVEAEICKTTESSLAFLLKIGAIDENEAKRVRQRERVRARRAAQRSKRAKAAKPAKAA